MCQYERKQITNKKELNNIKFKDKISYPQLKSILKNKFL